MWTTMRSYPQAGCDPVLIAVTTGTGGTATCRVTCTGAVRHGWLSQPGGGLGGSGGPAGDFAVGEADEAGVPGGDDGPGAVRGVAGPAGATAGRKLRRSALSAQAGCCPGRETEEYRSRMTAAR